MELYWIPLGAGGHSVRFNGRIFEAIEAARGHRSRCELYHAALIADLDGERHTIELAPSPNADEAGRGVVFTGPVGSRALGRLRLFRYELRCCRGGTIPDLGYAVGGPHRLTSDSSIVSRLLDGVSSVPRLVWGRDEARAGEMWNSNSVIAWLIVSAGLRADVALPAAGRAPGWSSGVILARRAAGSSPSVSLRTPRAASAGRPAAPRCRRRSR